MHIFFDRRLLCLLVLLIGCQSNGEDHTKNNDDARNDTTRFIPLRCGLYADQLGNIYFKTVEISEGPYRLVDLYIDIVWDTFESDSPRMIRDVVDTMTFRSIGSNYFVDTNHIYYFFGRSDGGSLRVVEEAHTTTFRVLSPSYYAVDNQRVYYRGIVVKAADARTFTAPVFVYSGKDTVQWYGRDKDNYYDAEDTLSKSDLEALMEDTLMVEIHRQ